MHDRDPEAINAETRPEIGYEYRDISVKGLIVSTTHFFVWTTVIIALTYVGFWALIDLPLRPETKPEVIPAFPNPLLQSNVGAKAEIRELKRLEEQHLNNYGWVDKEKGIARMPVDMAIDKLASEGIRPAPQTPTEVIRL